MDGPGVGTLMGLIEEALIEKFFPALFGGKETNVDFRKILGHSVNPGGLCIPDPQLSADSSYNIYKAASGELVDSLLRGSSLNYVGHRAFLRKESFAARRAKMHIKLGELSRRKDIAGGQERNRINRETRNGAWLSAVTHRLNGTELSRDEFQDNLWLRYGMMTQDTPATCNGCGKRFSIEHALSCPKVELVLERHEKATKEWVVLGARALVLGDITYETKINIRTV